MKSKLIDPLLNRVPPQAIEVEESLLCAIFIDASVLSEVRDFLKPEDFYKEAHKKIFEVILELPIQEEALDMALLVNGLKDKEYYESIGGRSYLFGIMNNSTMSLNPKKSAEAILLNKVKRVGIIKFSEGIQLGFKEGTGLDAFITQARNLIIEIEEEASRGAEVENLSLPAKDLFGKPLLKTPFDSLNKQIIGFAPKELTIVGAEEGIGKSAFCLGQLIQTAIKENQEVIYCAAQMSRKRIFLRILAQMLNINFRQLENGRTSKEKLKELYELHNKIESSKTIKHIILPNRLSLTDLEIKIKGAEKRSKNGVAIVFIENLQQIFFQGRNFGDNRFKESNFIIEMIAPFVRTLGPSFIISSQLTRNKEERNRRPTKEDICSTKAVEFADNIILLGRSSERKIIDGSTETKPGKPENAEIILDKGFSTGILPMTFFGEYMKWEERK